jgi:hypothetical protein
MDMPDVPIEGSGKPDYPSDMEARVRVLEEIAAGTKAILAEIRADQRAMLGEFRADQRAMRAEMAAGSTTLHAKIDANAASLRAEMLTMEQRRERDFRIMFGAIITTTLGLAYLIAHTAHWL